MSTHPEGHHAPQEQQPKQPHPTEMQPSVELQKPTAPEHQAEQLRQREQPIQVQEQTSPVEDAVAAMRRTLGFKKKQKPTQIPQVRDAVTVQIEKIMEEGLAEAFQELTPIEAQEFKIKGEKTALEIQQLLRSTRVKVKKIFKLLFSWLQLLPGVNRFFLEQEAKIKTDKIIALHNIRRGK